MLRLLLLLLITGCGEIDLKQYELLTVKAVPRGLDTDIPTPVTLIANDELATIYYTLDNSIPNEQSPVFDPASPIMIDGKTVALRFIAESGDKTKYTKYAYELYRWFGPPAEEKRPAQQNPK